MKLSNLFCFSALALFLALIAAAPAFAGGVEGGNPARAYFNRDFDYRIKYFDSFQVRESDGRGPSEVTISSPDSRTWVRIEAKRSKISTLEELRRDYSTEGCKEVIVNRLPGLDCERSRILMQPGEFSYRIDYSDAESARPMLDSFSKIDYLPTNNFGTGLLGSQFTYGMADHEGTLYVGTAGGLSISRDGGRTFETRTPYDGLGHIKVYGVWIDPDGSRLFAATEAGLSVSKDGGRSFIPLPLGKDPVLQAPRVHFVTRSKMGTLWVGTPLGAFVSDDHGQTWRKVQIPIDPDFDFVWPGKFSVSVIRFAPNGDVFLRMGHVVYRGSPDLKTWKALVRSKIGNNIEAFGPDTNLYFTPQGRLYFIDDGCARVANADGTGIKLLFPATSGSCEHTYGFGVSADGSEILAMNRGEWLHSKDFGAKFTELKRVQSEYHPYPEPHRFHFASNGKAYGTGLCLSMIDPNQGSFANLGRTNDLGGAYSYFVQADSENRVYLGKNYTSTTLDGLYISDDAGLSFREIRNVDNAPTAVARTEEGKVYVTTDIGIYRSIDLGRTFRSITPSDCCRYRRYEGLNVIGEQELYAVAEEGYLVHSVDGGQNYEKIPVLPNSGKWPIHDLRITKDRNFVIATHQGVGIRKPGHERFEFSNKGLPSYQVRRVWLDPHGTIYASTELGLAVSSDGGDTFTAIPSTQGLNIQKAMTNPAGLAFILTADHKLYYFHLNGDPAFTLKPITIRSHRLPSNEVLDFHATETGDLYIATDSGLARLSN